MTGLAMEMTKNHSDAYLAAMVEQVRLFQLRRHPAWREEESFDSRITGLPLYALEFNNHDRNPKVHGPTVAHYSPARCELQALAQTCKFLGPQTGIVDVGCGNGFIGSLLAREGVHVVGVDDQSWPQPQIPRFFDPNFYDLRVPLSLAECTNTFEVFFCSWMIPGANLTPQIAARHPVLIIHIFSLHNQADGSQETGSRGAFRCPDPYRVLGGWEVDTPADFFAQLDARFTAKSRKQRLVEIWSNQDYDGVRLAMPSDFSDQYDWDKERAYLNDMRRHRGLPIHRIQSRESRSS